MRVLGTLLLALNIGAIEAQAQEPRLPAPAAAPSESEALIQDALWTLMAGRTAIVIAHRLSTVRRMDSLVVLDGGRIVEQGSHENLLALGGIYASLWSRQSGGFLPATDVEGVAASRNS